VDAEANPEGLVRGEGWSVGKGTSPTGKEVWGGGQNGLGHSKKKCFFSLEIVYTGELWAFF